MKMTRRTLVQRGLTGAGATLAFGVPGGAILGTQAPDTPPSSENASPSHNGLTHYVAEFVVNTSYTDIPANVIEIGKKSILDGLGLALVGSVVKTGDLSRAYLK